MAPLRQPVTSADFPLVDFKPTLAYKINDHLSVRARAGHRHFSQFCGKGQAEAQLQGITSTPFSGLPLKLTGRHSRWDSMSAYLHAVPPCGRAPLVNVGFVYRRSPTLELHGQFLAQGTVVADTATTFHLPQTFTGAIALWPVRDQDHAWKLEVDMDYTDWSVFRNRMCGSRTGHPAVPSGSGRVALRSCSGRSISGCVRVAAPLGGRIPYRVCLRPKTSSQTRRSAPRSRMPTITVRRGVSVVCIRDEGLNVASGTTFWPKAYPVRNATSPVGSHAGRSHLYSVPSMSVKPPCHCRGNGRVAPFESRTSVFLNTDQSV